MFRLLQGDVGSGKTIVSLIAAINTINSGFQVAFMAPTEILSEQHYQSIKLMLKDFKINISLLYGGMKTREKKIVTEDIKLGNVDLIIGTHALIQNQIEFKNLALIIID